MSVYLILQRWVEQRNFVTILGEQAQTVWAELNMLPGAHHLPMQTCVSSPQEKPRIALQRLCQRAHL